MSTIPYEDCFESITKELKETRMSCLREINFIRRDCITKAKQLGMNIHKREERINEELVKENIEDWKRFRSYMDCTDKMHQREKEEMEEKFKKEKEEMAEMFRREMDNLLNLAINCNTNLINLINKRN
jgi:hypothetical protein